jgi:hypothetical protein
MRAVSLLRTGLVVSVMSFVLGLLGSQQEAAIRSEPRLDRRIPAPDPVVVVQSPGIVEADDEWIAALNRNFDEARALIKALGADVVGWPSA